jgi:hypothetical protein
MKALYVRICHRWGPQGLTISAWAWQLSREEDGSAWLRNRIDGLFLLLTGASNHCQAQYQRERGDR